MGLFQEFKEFALKGSVMDLAVGVIIGAAFGGLVKSLVDDVLMPPVGRLVGNLDFSNLYVSLSDRVDAANTALAQKVAATQPAAEGAEKLLSFLDTAARVPLVEARKLGPVIAYGNFLTLVINFLIIAMCIFIVIKMINTARRRMEREAPQVPPAPPEDVRLLTEIRDLLKAR